MGQVTAQGMAHVDGFNAWDATIEKYVYCSAKNDYCRLKMFLDAKS